MSSFKEINMEKVLVIWILVVIFPACTTTQPEPTETWASQSNTPIPFTPTSTQKASTPLSRDAAPSITPTLEPTEIPLPTLVQINEDGFGTAANGIILCLESFQGNLYAGTYGFSNGGKIYLYDGAWRDITPTDVFLDVWIASNDFHVFKDQLYMGVWGYPAEIWRTSDGFSWEKIILGSEEDVLGGTEISVFFDIGGYLYATVGDSPNGAEIWRSETGDSHSWNRVGTNGFGNSENAFIQSAVKYQDRIILGTVTDNGVDRLGTTARFYSSQDGENWSLLYEFNEDPPISQITSIKIFQQYLYAAVLTKMGDISARVIRCQICDGTDWEYVFRDQFDHIGNGRKPALIEFYDHLFLVVGNDTRDDGIEENNGLEIWRTRNGTDWIQVAAGGIDDRNNWLSYWENALIIHNGNLFLGTQNTETGAEVWEITD